MYWNKGVLSIPHGLPVSGYWGASSPTLTSRIRHPSVPPQHPRKHKLTALANPLLFPFPLLPQVLWRFLALGAPGGLMMGLECAAFEVTTAMAGYLGALQLAAHASAFSLGSLAFMCVPVAISIATGALGFWCLWGSQACDGGAAGCGVHIRLRQHPTGRL